ncbi:Hypothetical predicted protein [Olea europaea subsp. europaea]|uniref:Ubiquitin-like protease family profile domain-containing protein n=1 Tax=Olea europaea subsp. europaea TaxID=158383 RepID=A0A8S0P6W2_OLEEU|nr:Hypothetical predicted protein [Olea europaea subsp. europaea]
MNSIIQMQGVLKTNLMEIRTNMQFLSETVSAMISSSMEKIMRRFSDKAKDQGTEIHGVGDKGTHVARGSDKTDEPNVDRKGKGKIDPSEDIGTPYSLQPPSFDLGIEYTQPDDVHSEDVQKQVEVFTKPLFIMYLSQINYMDPRLLMVILNYRSNGFEARKDTVVSVRCWRRKKFNDEDDKIKPAFVIGSFPVGHKSWFYNLIYTESSLSSTDLDYHGPNSKELKVYIDSTLPLQTNGHDCGIFVILYALYILRDGRCSIPHKFDINKYRLGIAALLYKYWEMYMKHAKQGSMEEGMVIE